MGVRQKFQSLMVMILQQKVVVVELWFRRVMCDFLCSMSGNTRMRIGAASHIRAYFAELQDGRMRFCWKRAVEKALRA